METLLKKHYLIISSVISALILLVQGWSGQEGITTKTMLMGALTLVAGLVGKYLSGQGLSTAGIIGGAALAFSMSYEDGIFTWAEFAQAATLQILLVASSGLAKYKPTGTAIIIAMIMLAATSCSPYKTVQNDHNRTDKEMRILAQTMQQVFPSEPVSIISHQQDNDSAINNLVSSYDAFIAQLQAENT